MIGRKLAHYEITSHLGSGGMGDVYQATDTKLGRDVAIKLLPEAFSADADRLARFEREARVLASLNHSNIATIYGIERTGDRTFLVMELVDGETLAERIKRGPIPVDEALGIAKQIAEALETAHEKGIIHRDLKPANVKITSDGKVKVLDFGLAKAFAGESAAADLSNSPTLSIAATNAGVILGTAAYMSPEQAKGRQVDRRADIFSFGCVLYEMLTGRAAFEGEDIPDILSRVLQREPDWTPAPEKLQPLLRRCLEKDPKKRLRDIGDLWMLLEEQPVPLQPANLRRRLFRWIPWVAAVSLLPAAILGLVHLRARQPERDLIRFLLAPPENSQIQSFAISPDGRQIAMSVLQQTRTQLWVRSLDALEPRSLAGTDGAAFPFWSPDSRFIGFFAGAKLKKVAASAGLVEILCDTPNGRGATWNREGVILFSGANNLKQVAAAGGVPADVITQLSRFPVFLPDGRHFVYVAPPEGIFLGSLDKGESEPQRILPDNSNTSNVVVAPPKPGESVGFLLFVRAGILMAQPFDMKLMQLAGDLFPVADRILTEQQGNSSLISVSENGDLVYLSSLSEDNRQYAWYDRRGRSLGTSGEPGPYDALSLSPDGRQAAADHRPVSGRSDIWLTEFADGRTSRLTFDPTAATNPVWSPDGASIIFASQREDTRSLYRKLSSGAGQDELLLRSAENKFPKDWSRDGQFLLYVNQSLKTAQDLMVLPLHVGGKPFALVQTPALEDQGQFSPDTHWVAYTSNESGTNEIYVVPFPPSSGGGKWLVSRSGGVQPRWRRDGKELFYISLDRELMAVEVSLLPTFKSATPQPLFQTQMYAGGAGIANVMRWDVTADGTRFLINNEAQETDSTPMTVVVNWRAPLEK